MFDLWAILTTLEKVVKKLLEIAKGLPESQRDDLINQADTLNAIAGQIQTEAIRKEKKRRG